MFIDLERDEFIIMFKISILLVRNEPDMNQKVNMLHYIDR